MYIKYTSPYSMCHSTIDLSQIQSYVTCLGLSQQMAGLQIYPISDSKCSWKLLVDEFMSFVHYMICVKLVMFTMFSNEVNSSVWYKTKFGSQNLATKFGNHLCMATKIGRQC